ncbi:tyrosine-type recombinase/integrase [Streptomyces sp. JV185]|uniref:tyrosine-type recombinase/integrase n=1 Tax=Streptomyces sp. JV185 TaxID=858638 RepID=UPI002E787473|nr:tyrosine-type recombinase/integrase [Streptomyces sp. JV185]MEE1769271.1 tyrosine-type recombinase/integrase [Streptomyces sp. JV185]
MNEPEIVDAELVDDDCLPTLRRATEHPLLPAEFDDQLRTRLAALDAASDTHADGQRPDNTTRAYNADWKTWESFCTQLQIPTTAATRGTLRAFVDHLWNREKRAYSTIDRKLAGVTVKLRKEYRVIVDPEATKAARELLKDYRKQAAAAEEPERGRGKAPALRLVDLRHIVSMCDTDIFGLRDRAMLLLGFSIAARRAELAGLRLRNIRDDDNGLLVHVAVSKTDPRTVPVPFGTNPDTCPVRAWKAWRNAAQVLDPDRHAFRRIHHTGAVQPQGLTPQRAGDLITAAGLRAGFEDLFTGHSVRSGLATEARRAGKDRKAIAAITGHKEGSKVLDGYMQIVDQWDAKDNALIGLGL